MNAVRKEKVQVIASEPDPVLGYRKFTVRQLHLRA